MGKKLSYKQTSSYQMPSQNKQQEGVKSVLAVVMRSGKVSLGYKTTLRAIRKSKAKLIFISNNCPTYRKTQLEYYAVLAGIKTILYDGNNVDLGSACGKLYRIACLSIIDPGDSDILADVSGEKAANA